MHHQPRLDALLHSALAAELRDVRALVEEIAAVMVGNDEMALTYFEQFQGFDLIMQRAEESARFLDTMASGTCLREAIEQVRLSVIRDRLRAALVAPDAA
jgi:hypothetical protein